MSKKTNKNPGTLLLFTGAELVPIETLYAKAKIKPEDLTNAVQEWDKFAPEEYQGILNAK